MDKANLVYVDLKHTPKPPEFDGRWQPYRLIVKSGDNEEILFLSSEAYTNREDAISAAELAFGPQANVYLRESEHGNVELRLARDFEPPVTGTEATPL
jgi:uncharacterized protein YegP (UPF0339 family)